MAKINITHSCGHESRIDVYGPVKDRQRKADRIAERPCRDCAAAEAASANADLPALTGSPKQIAWAEQIRAAKRREIEEAAAEARRTMLDLIAHYEARGYTPKATREQAEAAIEAAVSEALSEPRAGAWIDNRDRTWTVRSLESLIQRHLQQQ